MVCCVSARRPTESYGSRRRLHLGRQPRAARGKLGVGSLAREALHPGTLNRPSRVGDEFLGERFTSGRRVDQPDRGASQAATKQQFELQDTTCMAAGRRWQCNIPCRWLAASGSTCDWMVELSQRAASAHRTNRVRS